MKKKCWQNFSCVLVLGKNKLKIVKKMENAQEMIPSGTTACKKNELKSTDLEISGHKFERKIEVTDGLC